MLWISEPPYLGWSRSRKTRRLQVAQHIKSFVSLITCCINNLYQCIKVYWYWVKWVPTGRKLPYFSCESEFNGNKKNRVNKKHSIINFFSIRDGRNWAKAGALTSILTSWSYSTSNWNCSTTLDSSTNSSMYEANPCHFQVTNMAFLPGLKKQINKANQFMSEKISGVEGTKAGLPVGSWMIDWVLFFLHLIMQIILHPENGCILFSCKHS